MSNDSRKMLDIICHALSEKKAIDLKAIDIREISVISDFFAIASASNPNQMQALADAVQEDMHKAGYHTKQIEGNSNSSWILLDFNDVIVHLFTIEDRHFYNLERIWSDGKKVTVDK